MKPERAVPHKTCPVCGAPPYVGHRDGCLWQRSLEPVVEMTAAKLGLIVDNETSDD